MPSLAEHRRQRYAVHTLALGDGNVPGAASLYDTALTNGLLAIVAYAWPAEVRATGHTPPASKLLELIKGKTGQRRWMLAEFGPLPFEGDEPAIRVEVDLDLLADALAATQGTRHGREGDVDVVPTAVIEALRNLDTHDALHVLSSAQADHAGIAAAAARAAEWERASEYTELIGEEELGRRASRADEALPVDPKERYNHLGLGHCPMCGHMALVISAVLEYGTEIGTCYACSYSYTANMAEDEEFTAMLRSHDHE